MSTIKTQGENQAKTVDKQHQAVEALICTLQAEREAKKSKSKAEKRVRRGGGKRNEETGNDGAGVDMKDLELKLLQQLSMQSEAHQQQSMMAAAGVDPCPSSPSPIHGFKSPPELVGDPTLKEFTRWESR